jgi:hypothetical protein
VPRHLAGGIGQVLILADEGPRRMVTGPVSMPLIGFWVRDCAYALDGTVQPMKAAPVSSPALRA